VYISIHKQFVDFEIALTFSFGFAREGVRSYFLISCVSAGHMTLYCSQPVACDVWVVRVSSGICTDNW